MNFRNQRTLTARCCQVLPSAVRCCQVLVFLVTFSWLHHCPAVSSGLCLRFVMATCPRIKLVTDQHAFRSSTTAVKAIADSTELRPRRSRANYKVKDSGKKPLQCHAPKGRFSSKKEAVLSKQKAESNAEQNMRCNQRHTVVMVVKSPVKKELKRKAQKAVEPKQKKLKIMDRRSGEEEEPFGVEDKQMYSTDGNQNGGCKDRLLMRQWLEAEANRGNIPGLQWLDKNEKLIQIAWRHGSRSEWSTSDVMVFKCWAQHTGRYNSKNHDYKRWKANFRCALNSLQDVKEVAAKRSTKSHDPYKVYRLLPAIPPKKRRRESVKSSNSSLAESTCNLTTEEEAVLTDCIVDDLTDPSDVLMNQDLFQHLMPLPGSSGYEPILPWHSVDSMYEAVEILEPIDVPLTYVDHCYADMETIGQLRFQPLPPFSSSPSPFNDAIPVPVQDLIDSSEEFQTLVDLDESLPVLDESIPVSEVLTSSCDVYVHGEMNNIQAYTISSTNESNLESMLQLILNVPALSASCELTSLDQSFIEQTQ